MSKIKLILAAPTFYPFYGGAEMRFKRYLPMLREFGIESSVFTGTPKAKKITQEHKKESWYSVAYGEQLPVENYNGIEVVRYRLPEKPAKKRLGMYHHILRESIKSNYSDTNLIQFLSPFTMSTIETFKFAKKNNIKTLVACTLAKKPHPNIVKRIIKHYQTWKIYSSCDCIVVSSEEMRGYLQKFGVKNRIEVIGNGVDIQRYKPIESNNEKEEIKGKLGITPDRKILLNVGSVHPRKGTDLLLKAFEIVVQQRDDVDLYIAGPRVDKQDKSQDIFSQEINKLVSKPNLKGKVHFLGLVNNVNEYMKAADVFVFPSREEGMGNVVMEAMASGIPVVVTPYLGFPKAFGKDKEHYLMAEYRDSSVADNILRVLTNKTLCDDLVNNAINNIECNLNLDKSIQKFASLYMQLANKL